MHINGIVAKLHRMQRTDDQGTNGSALLIQREL